MFEDKDIISFICKINECREEILKAFIAKYGYDPDLLVQVVDYSEHGRIKWYVKQKEENVMDREIMDFLHETTANTINAKSIGIRTGHPMFYSLLDELKLLHSRKNHDYNAGEDPLKNLKECEEWGLPAWKGVIGRMSDKWCRIKGFAKRETLDVTDETVEDTLKDLAVYSLLCLVLYKERKGLNVTPKVEL